MLKPSESGEQITFARTADQFESDEAGVQGYICKNCGAELMTEDTTTATECPYCGSPTILPDRIDGSVKLDDKLTESLEPYDLSAAIPFQSAVLAGGMADHADADSDQCEKRAVERVEHSVEQAMRDTVKNYTSVTERTRSIHTENGSATPALMPVWLITTEKEGKTYTFAINGQTGKLTCDVPADKKKSLL